uniref:Uncharacterized protein n=1 Tax=Anser cygnoides TaxID=8845 RepID=A0A8B9E219_ANSCY
FTLILLVLFLIFVLAFLPSNCPLQLFAGTCLSRLLLLSGLSIIIYLYADVNVAGCVLDCAMSIPSGWEEVNILFYPFPQPLQGGYGKAGGAQACCVQWAGKVVSWRRFWKAYWLHFSQHSIPGPSRARQLAFLCTSVTCHGDGPRWQWS